jgi:hypothetical protein
VTQSEGELPRAIVTKQIIILFFVFELVGIFPPAAVDSPAIVNQKGVRLLSTSVWIHAQQQQQHSTYFFTRPNHRSVWLSFLITRRRRRRQFDARRNCPKIKRIFSLPCA